MAKRKREAPAEPEVARSDKAKQFTNKLAKTLVAGKHPPIQAARVAAVFEAAVANLPAESSLRRVLQQNLGLYTELLLTKLVELQQDEGPEADTAAKNARTDLPNTPGAQCLSLLCHRSCQTAQEKVVRCRHILATCVNVIPSGLMQQEPGLTVSLDAIRVALEELCTASTDPSERAAQAKLMQPVVAQLSTIIMLNNTASSSSLSGHSSMSQAELQRTGAEALLLAVEMRYMLAEQLSSSGRHVPLAALDIEDLTGGHSDAILELLLQDELPCVSPEAETARALWEIMYKATLHLPCLGNANGNFLLRIAAAQKACIMMPASRNDFLGAFDSVPAPASLIAWLQRQPRSVIVGQCLGALHRSPLKLTQHLLMSNMTRALLALQQPIALTEEQLTKSQPDPQEADEALFYVDEAGESAFDRGWDDKLADEAGSAGTNKHGLDLGDLPSAQITAVTHDSSDDE